jgi:hypothetical protein
MSLLRSVLLFNSPIGFYRFLLITIKYPLLTDSLIGNIISPILSYTNYSHGNLTGSSKITLSISSMYALYSNATSASLIAVAFSVHK